MQRLARVKNPYKPEDIAFAQQAISLLNRHLPPASRSLFAHPSPIPNTDNLDWLSPRNGQIKPFSDLQKHEQNQLLAQVESHKHALVALQEKLTISGDHSSAALVTQLLSSLESAQLYSVDGYPVFSNWTSQTEQTPTLTTPITPTPLAPQQQGRRWLWSILLLLLLLTILFALWYFWLYLSKRTTTPPTPTQEAANTTTSAIQPIQSYACMAKQGQTTLPPDFTVILDNSASMTFNLTTTRADELWYLETNEFTLEELQKVKSLFSGTTRFEVAQRSINSMMTILHPDISTRLISFGECGTVYDHGVFTHQHQQQFIREVLRLEPESATPSAQALYEAAQKMDGVEKDGVIILFIDGEDGCGMDICEIAESIAQEKPRIRINVVDISNFGLSNCVAQKTGGKVYSSNDAVQINEMLKNSIQELSSSPEC